MDPASNKKVDVMQGGKYIKTPMQQIRYLGIWESMWNKQLAGDIVDALNPNQLKLVVQICLHIPKNAGGFYLQQWDPTDFDTLLVNCKWEQQKYQLDIIPNLHVQVVQ